MTSAHKPIFLIVSNNPAIALLSSEVQQSEDITIKTSLPSDIDKLKLEKINYIIFFLQRSQQDQETTSSLINLYDLAKNHQSKIAIVDIYKNQIDEDEVNKTYQLLNQLSGNSPLFRYIITKDIFQDKDSGNTFSLEQDIQQVLITKKIEISSSGENLIYPLNLEDLIAAVLKSLFLERIAGKQLTIIGDPIKDLELSYIIKDELEKTDSTLNIDTSKKDISISPSTQNASAESRALLKWLPSDLNEEKLKKKIQKLLTEKPINRLFETKKESLPIKVEDSKPFKKTNLHKTEKKFLIKIPVILIAISLIAVSVISLLYIFLLGVSLQQTKNSLTNLNTGNTEEAANKIQLASKYLQAGEDVSRYILPVFRVISPKQTNNLNNFSSLLRHSQSTIQSINECYQLANNLYHDLFLPTGNSTALDISLAIQSRLRTIHQELSQIEIISQNHTLPSFFSQKLKNIDFAQKINVLKNQTSQGLTFLEAFTGLLNNAETQYIALIVQDENEIKSTGGTIRAIVLANIEKQKIVNIRTLSPGQIDQQMVGDIPATPIIETLTGTANLSFTNSNISPNFTVTSLLIEKFLKNSINYSPDLIVGITTQSLADLLKETGSQQQFFQELAQSAINHQASQTTIFLLDKTIVDLQAQTIPLIKLVRPTINTLNQDNLRIWFKDPAKENAIINYALAGNIFNSTCHPLLNQNSCFSDIAFLAENNLSIAPFNFYSSRKLQHTVTIQNQSIIHSFILNYDYQSIPEQINRDYQALYQIYLHKNAQFLSLERNNQKIDISPEKESLNDFSLFQIPLTHKPKDNVSIKISFIIDEIALLNNTENFAYSLKTYHQPGFKLENDQLIINHPSGFQVSSITSSATINSEKIIYQPMAGTNTNSIFGVQFANQPHVE